MEFEIVMTDSSNPDFTQLIKILDQDLSARYGELQKQYDKHNKVDYIKNVVIAYEGNYPVACGAYKEYDSSSAEIKRIFVREEYRNRGLATRIMNKLEELARAGNYKCCILETGVKQQEAIGLYQKNGYGLIPNYGPYAGNLNSICMKKFF